MSTEQLMSLRDVALGLAKVRGSRQPKIADGKLLTLLRAGELNAGFEFPGLVTRWIQIPATYWMSVGSDKFRAIRHKSGNKKMTGAFKVRLGQFANEYLEAVRQHPGKDGEREGKGASIAQITDELKAALSLASQRFEVVIRERDWLDYLQRHNLEEPMPQKKAKAGRSEMPGWRKLSVIIGAYLIKHQTTTKETIKIEEAAKEIHEIAKNENTPGLPHWTTIKDVLSQIRSTADTLLIN
jgi:hypothetical protein